ncbi:MAG: cytochrome c subfamily [Gammaproteobacteria bacterium]|nr:cytochrome c subfamily [Gammaproteobacteria bacterium]
MAKTMSLLHSAAALAATVALALVQVPALAQTTSGSSAPPAATAPAAAAPAASDASKTTDPATSGPVDPFAHGTAAAGATKAAVCSACHGPNGNSANPDWPRLAGQSAVYIAEQLRMFRAGTRDNPIMKPLAGSLSDQDISDLAVYYQAQTVTGLEADPSFWKAGSDLYRRGDKARNIPACIACHGPVGRGNLAAGYPALRAQESVYVVKQLNDYASGARYVGTNVATVDPNSAMMLAIAKRLTPEDIRNVASYVQGMR